MQNILSDFDRSIRAAEIEKRISEEKFVPAAVRAVNTHIHTFYSYNVEGNSPTEVLYRAKKVGMEVAGIVDFDVLDAMEEVFTVSEQLKLRAVVALESRVYVADYAERDINSPGESGVCYFMGTGFTRMPEFGTAAHKTLQSMRTGASIRNVQLLERLADVLAPLKISYKNDVCTLTPADNATERHILEALDLKSREMFAGEELEEYWAKRLMLPESEVRVLLGQTAKFRNTIRAKLMKRGGVGYKQPDEDTFPPLSEVAAMISELGALPCWAWVDGFSDGESDAEELCDYMVSVGTRAIAIIPERNWHFEEPELKAKKLQKLAEFVAAGKKRNLVITVGTEMNNYGQPFVDDFAAPELAPYVEDFLAGAYTLYGHTLLERAAGKGIMSQWAVDTFGDDYAACNEFYRKLGEASADPENDGAKLAGLESYTDLDGIINVLK